MISITTKYLPCTDHRGSRIKAYRADHDKGDTTLTVPYDHALNLDENHVAAALALASKLSWHGTWHTGFGAPGYAHHVMATEPASFEVAP